MKPDVIITWPRNADYPLWRQMIRDNRDRFNEIIIVFMETNQGLDFRQFIRESMFQDHVLFVESPPVLGGEDWRNVSVNAGLMHSLHSEWIWFTEQDFLPGKGFWEEVEDAKNGVEVVASFDDARMHPCSIFIKRSALNQTSKNFAADPPHHDHFGRLQKDIASWHWQTAVIDPDTYHHLAGLSHNMRLITNGELPNHKPEEFNKYLADCLRTSVAHDPRFENLAIDYLNMIDYSFGDGHQIDVKL